MYLDYPLYKLDNFFKKEYATAKFSQSEVKANFEKIGKIVIMEIDSVDKKLIQGETLSIPIDFKYGLLRDTIVTGTTDASGIKSGSIRISKSGIVVQQSSTSGTLINAVWFIG